MNNNNGFLIIDSMLSILIFTTIVGVLIPAALTLQQLNSQSDQLLNFNRRLYLELMQYDTYDAFLKENQVFDIDRGEICDKQDEHLCFKKE